MIIFFKTLCAFLLAAIIVLSVLLCTGNLPSEPQLTDEEVTQEYNRLLDEQIKAMKELNELLKLRNKLLEGKAHSA